MSPKMVDLKKAAPVEEYRVHGKKKKTCGILSIRCWVIQCV